MKSKKKKDASHLAGFQFKPGKSGNPQGRPRNPIPDALRHLTRQSFQRVIKFAVKGNVDQLSVVIRDPASSVLEVAIASCLLKAIQRGDYGTVESILSRVLGKTPDHVIVDAKTQNQNLNVNVSAAVDSARLKAAMRKLEEEV